MDRAGSTSCSSRMSRSRKVVIDHELFVAAMRDAKPLARKKRKVAPQPAADAAILSRKETGAAATPPIPSPLRGESPGEGVRRVAPAAPNPGIDRRTAERLRRGEMEIDTRLDLHGMTEAAAHATLDRAVASAWRAGLRVLLVITGKGSLKEGGGVLRRNVPRWLAIGANAAQVLRVETAQARHGGSGAYYVLLRRQRS